MRAADVRICETCKRGTGHNRKGECLVCRTRQRRALRGAKANALGSPLVRFGDLMKVADDLWSVWVRASHDRCEMCLVPYEPGMMQWAHGISRSDRPIRYEPTNGYALCAGCHRRHTPPGPAWWEWMERHIGTDDYERLKLRSMARGSRLRQSDVHLVILDAQQRIKTLPESDRKEWAKERVERITERMVRLGVAA